MNKLDQLEIDSRNEYLEQERAFALLITRKPKSSKLRKPKLESSFPCIVICGNVWDLNLEAYGFTYNHDYKVLFKQASYKEYEHFHKELNREDIGVGYLTKYEDMPLVYQSFQTYKNIAKDEFSMSHPMQGKIISLSRWLGEQIQVLNQWEKAIYIMKVLNVKKETHKGYLMELDTYDYGKVELWIAKSQIDGVF